MQLRIGRPGAELVMRVGILAVTSISLAACHTDVAVRASTRAISEAANAPGPPDRALALQISIEVPSADTCRQLASALPQRAKNYGMEATGSQCVNNGAKHLVEFGSEVPVVVVPNSSRVLQGPLTGNDMFEAYITTFKHVMRERRMGRGYTLTLFYNQTLFRSLQADLAKEDPPQKLELSDIHLSLDLENDLGTNEVVQLSSAFVDNIPIVNSTANVLAPRQFTNAAFSDVADADFGKRGHRVLVSFYPAD